MAKTQLADIIVPSQFAGYVLQRTAEKSDLFQSGIVIRTPDYDERASIGGNQVNMPHWNDLPGNRQPLSDSAPLVPAKLVAEQDIARIHNDGNAWSWNHLATGVAGDDPALALANFMADYWNRQNQYMLISSLKGVISAASMAGNLLADAIKNAIEFAKEWTIEAAKEAAHADRAVAITRRPSRPSRSWRARTTPRRSRMRASPYADRSRSPPPQPRSSCPAPPSRSGPAVREG